MSEHVEDDAIMRRLGRLRAQYQAFTGNERARLLRWRLRDDERRMVDAFVAAESDARLQRVPDLLVQLGAAFEQPAEHGRVLRDELVAQYEHARAAAPSEDPELAPELDWVAPPVSAEGDDVEVLVGTAVSLAEHHAELLQHLTLVLQPEAMSDPRAWGAWLRRLVPRLPEHVRAIVLELVPGPEPEPEPELDANIEPGLDDLAQAEPERVVTRVAALDMDGAMLELSEGRADDRSAEAEVRRGFVRMMVAGKHGDPETAVSIGTPALHTACREGRWDLVATLQMAMGSLYGAHGRPEAASERYVAAEAAAAHAEAQGDPAAGRLRIQARMAEGATRLRLEQWSDAARAYQQAAGLAEGQGELHLALDGWRLASLAHERGRVLDEAWRCGVRALRAGEAIPPAERGCTTLPHTGEALLRLADESRPPAELELPPEGLAQRLDAVLGAGWRAG